VLDVSEKLYDELSKLGDAAEQCRNYALDLAPSKLIAGPFPAAY